MLYKKKGGRHYQKVGSKVVVPAPVVPCHGVEKSSSWKSNQSSKTKIIVKKSSLLTMQLCKYFFKIIVFGFDCVKCIYFLEIRLRSNKFWNVDEQ